MAYEDGEDGYGAEDSCFDQCGTAKNRVSC